MFSHQNQLWPSRFLHFSQRINRIQSTLVVSLCFPIQSEAKSYPDVWSPRLLQKPRLFEFGALMKLKHRSSKKAVSNLASGISLTLQ